MLLLLQDGLSAGQFVQNYCLGEGKLPANHPMALQKFKMQSVVLR
jgi:hypothetical protein